MTIIEIKEYFFDEGEILLLECDDLDYNFVLDIDTFISDAAIIEHIRGYYILGHTGGLVRKGKYAPWEKMPITQESSLDSCKCCKEFRQRTFKRIEHPYPEKPYIVAKEVIE